MNTKTKKPFATTIYLLIAAAILIIELYQVNNVAKAQGMGYYFQMLFGGNRDPYVYMVDVIDIIVMILMAVVPLVWMKKMTIKNFARILLMLFAFEPIMDYSQLVHLFDEKVFGVWPDFYYLASVYRTALVILGPCCIILYMVIRHQGIKVNTKAVIAVTGSVLVLMLASVAFITLSYAFSLVLYLILTIYFFSLNDSCTKINIKYDRYCNIIFAIMFLAGLYFRIEKAIYF